MKDFYCLISSRYCIDTDARDAVIPWCHCRRDADYFPARHCASARHARQTIIEIGLLLLLLRETPKFICPAYEPPIAPILILLITTQLWRVMQDRVLSDTNLKRGRSETTLG